MRLLFAIVFTAGLCFPLSPALAFGGLTNGFLLQIAGAAIKQNTRIDYNTGTSSSLTDIIQLDGKIGWITENGYYFGALYNSKTQSDIFNTDRSELWGPGIGYTLPNGFITSLHYLFDGHFKDDSASIKYTSPSAIQFDIGFLNDFTSSMFWGLNYTYKSISYTKRSPTSATFSKYNLIEQNPQIIFGILF